MDMQEDEMVHRMMKLLHGLFRDVTFVQMIVKSEMTDNNMGSKEFRLEVAFNGEAVYWQGPNVGEVFLRVLEDCKKELDKNQV